MREYICIGLLAHVDAGKTTLSEALLHRTGAIRSAGRVDHGDAFLDTDSMERDRGRKITEMPEKRIKNPVVSTGLPAAGHRSSGYGLWWTLRDMRIFPPRWSAPCRFWITRS